MYFEMNLWKMVEPRSFWLAHPMDISLQKGLYLSTFLSQSNSNFVKKFSIWGRFRFADFSSDWRPINSLVNISAIKENIHWNISRVVMHFCSQCEFISWLNIKSYSFFTWKLEQNVRQCFSAYAAKWCAVLWLNHEGSESGLNKLSPKIMLHCYGHPIIGNFIHEKGLVRCSSNYCPNCLSRAISNFFVYNNSLRELNEQEAVAISQHSTPLTHNIYFDRCTISI